VGHEDCEVLAVGLLAGGPEVLGDASVLLHAEEGDVKEDAEGVAEGVLVEEG